MEFDDAPRLTIVLSASDGMEHERAMDIGELGMYLTAISRWANSVYDNEYHNLSDYDKGPGRNYYSPQIQEPRLLKFQVARIANGSVFIDTVVRFLDGHIVTATFLAGLFTNTAYDVLKGNLQRAHRRVMYGDQEMAEPDRHIHLKISLRAYDHRGQPATYEQEVVIDPTTRVHRIVPDDEQQS
jgi:hypothetical protein